MLVYRARASQRVLEDIQAHIDSGQYELIFEQGNYLFVKINE